MGSKVPTVSSLGKRREGEEWCVRLIWARGDRGEQQDHEDGSAYFSSRYLGIYFQHYVYYFKEGKGQTEIR
jgi:hypothetical protein